MREYGRKPYLSNSHNEMMRRITDKQINDQKLLRQSEMKKPYMNDTYQEMENYYPNPWGDNPDNPYPYFPEPPAPDVYPSIGDGGCHPQTFIGYTTLSMVFGETQMLYIGNYVPPVDKYLWTVRRGSLKTYGSNAIFTAPDTNPFCKLSYVDLYCSGKRYGGIGIMVRSKDEGGIAYSKWNWVYECSGPDPFGIYRTASGWVIYHCDGTVDNFGSFTTQAGTDPGCGSQKDAATAEAVASGFGSEPGVAFDRRTDEQKEAGCCPQALF